MFSFSGNLLAGQHDTQKERPPPSKPIPVTFPLLRPPEPSISAPPAAWSKQGRISAHFLGLKKPSDVTENTLALLNITFQPECDFETLLSSLSNSAHSHLVPKSWLGPSEHMEPFSNTDSAVTRLSNGRRLPDQRDFHVRARELYFDNSDAFSTLSRKGNGGQAAPRLAHFRKFWEGLDNMAYYWENSLDQYSLPFQEAASNGGETASVSLMIDADAKSENTASETKTDWTSTMETGLGSLDEEPRKKAKTQAVSDTTVTESLNSNDFSSGSTVAHTAFIIPSRILAARIAPSKGPWATNMDSKPVDFTQGSYRGYRIGNGTEMPDQYRIDCVRNFLEPIAWAFGVTLSPHRRPPVLTLEHVRFPVRMSCVAWRGPKDRAKARQGWMEGPLLGVQCRADVNFGITGKLDAESILDAVRELGGLLLLAQERAREGKTEKRSGDGKWWTTRKRWGGGAGGEIGEATGVTDTSANPKAETKPVERNRDGSKTRRRPSPAEVWKILRPGNPLWDPKVAYEAIGKDKSAEWDDVFMVSSLNHHISLLKLRIHPLYLQYLAEGTLPEDAPSDSDWCSPKLQRTRWFDLFDTDDRTEAYRGMWSIMSYLMRANKTHDDSAMDE